MKFRFPHIPARLVWFTAAVLLAGIALATSDQWVRPVRTWVASTIASFQEEPARDAESRDDQHEHEHDDTNTLELSDQARRNIGLTEESIGPVKLRTFTRSISVPAVVVERPERTHVEISAHMTGVVTGVHVAQGEAVHPGAPLLSMRLTHEDLVNKQSEFLKTLGELDVVNQDIARLRQLSQGLAPSRLRERLYEKQRLEVVLGAHRESLLLHALTEKHIADITSTGKLVREIDVRVPELNHDASLRHHSTDEEHQAGLSDSGSNPASPKKPEFPASPVDAPSVAASAGTSPPTSRGNSAAPPAPFIVQKLNVHRGESVEAGNSLLMLADYSELYIEGRAFEQDSHAIERAAAAGWPVAAIRERNGSPTREQIEGLSIVYVDNEVDIHSRALRFYVRLPNNIVRSTQTPEGRRYIAWGFKPGQRMTLRVPVEEWPDRIVLPVEAVVREGAESYVFVEDGRYFDRRPVHVEYQDQVWAVIANDGSLFPGEPVALTGAYQMQMALKQKAAGPADAHAGHHH